MSQRDSRHHFVRGIQIEGGWLLRTIRLPILPGTWPAGIRQIPKSTGSILPKKNAEMMLFGRNSLHQIDVKRRIPGADCPPEAMKNICIYGQKSSFHATRPPTKKLNTWRRARNYPVDKNVPKFWSGDIKHGSEISHTWASNGIYNQKNIELGSKCVNFQRAEFDYQRLQQLCVES